jgi:23S rRNA (cytidine1920-2'-O)/16S rRNA (cytidine1409-2'-O)-methyltransferase
VRLDLALVEAGLAPSRQRAQALILAGLVTVNSQTVRRADLKVVPDDRLAVAETDPYASRGALKLIPALDAFGVIVEDRVCADIGASSGGFTDVLLRRGARRVYAVDVGRGLIDWRLRQDPRVVLLERTNARHLRSFPEPVTLVTIDVSFIGLEKVLPAIREAAPQAEVVALFKPQFEVGPALVGKGGVVRDPDVTEAAIAAFRSWCAGHGYNVLGQTPAGVAGPAGNQEHFLHLSPA